MGQRGKFEDRWSPQEDALFRRLWAAGTAQDEIAHQVGRTVSSVKHRRVTLGLPTRMGRVRPVSVKVWLDGPVYDELKARARDRTCPVSTLIRSILRRETGFD